MFINKDLLGFFDSMIEIKMQKRDVFTSLAMDVDDPEMKKSLLQISANEQHHIDQLQKSVDLVNGFPSHQASARSVTEAKVSQRNEFTYELEPTSSPAASPASTEPAIQIIPDIMPPVKVEEKPQPTTVYAQNINTNDITIAPTSISLPRFAEQLQNEIPIQQSIGVVKTAQDLESNSLIQSTASKTLHSMNTFKHPLAEIFGFTATDFSQKAQRYRSHRQCPFNNKVPNCTNDQTKNPLGVCSILHNNKAVITCPVRFREDWLITDDAASFFFEDGVRWSSLTAVQLTDAYGKSAGELDVVLVAYDDAGKIVDFGAIEIQAAYIAGDPRDPFEYYMKDPKTHAMMDWSAQSNYPEPDYVTSARENLVPQLIFKGSILNSWHKKMAVAISRSYFEALPNLVSVKQEEAEIAWLIYDLESVVEGDKESYQLRKSEVIYTKFQATLSALTASYPDNVEHFMKLLPEIADN